MKAVKLQPRERGLIAVAGIVAALSALWVVIIEPAITNSQGIVAELHAEERLLAWERFLEANQGRILSLNERQEHLLTLFRGGDGAESGQGKDSENYVTTAVADIQRLAGDAALQLTEVRPQVQFSGAAANARVKATTLLIEAKGTFGQFARFLARLQDKEPGYDVTRVQINSTRGETLGFSLLITAVGPDLQAGTADAGAGKAGSAERGLVGLRDDGREVQELERVVARPGAPAALAALMQVSIFRPVGTMVARNVTPNPGQGPAVNKSADPTAVRLPGPPAAPARGDPFAGMNLAGVATIGNTRYALLQLPNAGEGYYREGDMLSGFHVDAVGGDFVVLSDGSVTKRLKLGDSFSVVPLAGK